MIITSSHCIVNNESIFVAGSPPTSPQNIINEAGCVMLKAISSRAVEDSQKSMISSELLLTCVILSFSDSPWYLLTCGLWLSLQDMLAPYLTPSGVLIILQEHHFPQNPLTPNCTNYDLYALSQHIATATFKFTTVTCWKLMCLCFC